MLIQDSRLKFPVSGDGCVLLFPNAGSVPFKRDLFPAFKETKEGQIVPLSLALLTQNNQYAIEVHFGAVCPGPQECVCVSITAVVLNQEFLCRLKVVYLAWFVVKMYFWPNKMFVREFAWFVFIPTLSFKMLTFYLNSLKEKIKRMGVGMGCAPGRCHKLKPNCNHQAS